jgi:hypothetical protein
MVSWSAFIKPGKAQQRVPHMSNPWVEALRPAHFRAILR